MTIPQPRKVIGMKPWYRWSILYALLLGVAFFATVEPSSAFRLLANSIVDDAANTQAVETVTISNTVSAPETIQLDYINAMNNLREGHLAIQLADGRILVAGGNDDPSGTNLLVSSELYNSVTGQWSPTGNLNVARGIDADGSRSTITLLNSGKVLIVGGSSGSPLSAEVYDPATGTWALTVPMNSQHKIHTATRLLDGRVLVVGGDSTVAEIYNPADGSWAVTGPTNEIRYNHAAVLLADGKVLVSGGSDGYLPTPANVLSATAEVYDPTTGLWSTVSSMNTARSRHKAIRLPDNKVLVAGLDVTAEVYDPTTDTWTDTGARDSQASGMPFLYTPFADQSVLLAGDDYWFYNHLSQTWSTKQSFGIPQSWRDFTIVPLSTTKLLFTGGQDYIRGWHPTNRAGIATPFQDNQFTATLTVPSGWITTPATVSFVATSTAAPVVAVGLSNEDVQPSEWITVTSGVEASTVWDFGSDSANKNVYLFVRDSNGYAVKVVTAAVKVDQSSPSSFMSKPWPNANGTIPQWPYSPATFPVSWQGSDAMSGIAGYDLEVKTSTTDWTRVLTNTTLLEIDYTGVNEESYYFRVRARDVAGNVEAWLDPYDGMTQVDDEAPIGNLNIASVGTTSVLLLIDATDNLSGVAQMKVALADDFDDAVWENYATTKTISFGGPSPSAFIVYIQFRDAVGNISTIQCASYGPPACYQLALPIIRLRSNQ